MSQVTREIIGMIISCLFLYKYIPAILKHARAKKIRGVSISEKTSAIIALTLQAIILIDVQVYTLATSTIIAMVLDCVIIYYRVIKQKNERNRELWKRLLVE